MNIRQFTGCCTAKILTGLGGTITAEDEFRPKTRATVEDIKSFIGTHVNNLRVKGDAVITATTNNEQTVANQALEELGFQSSGWMSKAQHPETKLKLWWLPLENDING